MALRRRFLAETELHLQSKGFLRPRRWLCAQPCPHPPNPPSSSSKNLSKKSQAAKEKRTQAVESFVKSYMLTHPGVFPKVAEIQKEVGGSWNILKEILIETKSKVLLVSQDDKKIGKMDPHVTTELTAEATEIKENADYCKLDRQQERFILSTEKLAVMEPQIPAKKDMAVLAAGNISDNVELVEGKEIDHSTEGLTSSSTVLDKQLPYLDGELHKEEETSGVLPTGICSSETIFRQVAPSINGDCTEINCTASDHTTLETATGSQEFNRSTLEIPFNDHLPSQESSDVYKPSEEFIRLINFIKRREEKEVLSCTEGSNSRHEVDSDIIEGKNHVKNLVDIFKKNQSSTVESNLIHENSINQERCITPNEEHGDSTTKVKGFLSQIIGLPNENVKVESQFSVPSNNTNRFNSELKASVPENLNIASWIKDHTSSNHLDKTEVIKRKGEAKRPASMEINSNSFDDREKEPGIRGTGNGNLHLDKNGEKMDSADICDSYITSEDDSDVTAFDYMKPTSTDEVPLSAKGLNSNSSAQETGSDRNRNCLLVKFLRKTAKTNDIALCFGDCGPIADIHIVPSRRENRYNFAYVYFKTEEGLRKALSRDDVAVCGADVVVEPACSIVHSRLFNMGMLNDTDFPLDFLKNPTRTVVVKGLPDNLPFHQLRQILSSWGNISGFAMGSSSSSVYVEFESEESKERILVEATISVKERKLPVLRVDAPKTTVVRITNVNPLSGVAKVCSICDSYGQVKRIVGRDIDTFDVHFKLSDWINMVTILNRLNGLLVDQNQWVAQPATVFPAEVLQALWNRPGGHKQVHGLLRDICRRVQEKSIDTAPLLGLTRECYAD